VSEVAGNALLAFAIAFLWMVFAAIVLAVTGFALAPVALPVLVLLYGVKPAIIIILITGTIGMAPVIWHGRSYISWRTLLPILGGTFVGAPVGVLILAAADAFVLKLAIGIMTLLFAVPMFGGYQWRMRRPALIGTAAGAGSGLV
jgi:uncharacterized membrane protein YfcA